MVVAANLSVFPYRPILCPVLFQEYLFYVLYVRSDWFPLRDLPQDLSHLTLENCHTSRS